MSPSAERVAVVGKTQSGKTTTAKWFARQLCGNDYSRKKLIVIDPTPRISADRWKPDPRVEVYSRADLLRALRKWTHEGDMRPIVWRNVGERDWSPLDRLNGYVLAVDEAKRFCKPGSIDPSFLSILSEGRHREIDTIVATQGPSQCHPEVWGGLTYVAVHALSHRAHRKAVCEHLSISPRLLRWKRIPGTAKATYPLWFDGDGEQLNGVSSDPDLFDGMDDDESDDESPEGGE